LLSLSTSTPFMCRCRKRADGVRLGRLVSEVAAP